MAKMSALQKAMRDFNLREFPDLYYRGADAPPFPIHGLAEIFPPANEDDYRGMWNSIKRNGVNHPVLVTRMDDGQLYLVDGKIRQEIAGKLGLPLPYEVLPEGTDLRELVLEMNVNELNPWFRPGRRVRDMAALEAAVEKYENE